MVAAALTAAVAAALPAAASASTLTAARPAGNPGQLVQVSAKPKLPGGARVAGAVAASATVSATLAMRLPNQSAVTAFIDATANPRSSQYHHYLSKGQFATQVRPVDGRGRGSGVSASRRRPEGDRGVREPAAGELHRLGQPRRRHVPHRPGARPAGRRRDGPRDHLRRSGCPPRSPGRSRPSSGSTSWCTRPTGHPVRSRRSTTARRPDRPRRRSPADQGRVPIAQEQQQGGAVTDQQLASSYGLDPLYAAGDLGDRPDRGHLRARAGPGLRRSHLRRVLLRRGPHQPAHRDADRRRRGHRAWLG